MSTDRGRQSGDGALFRITKYVCWFTATEVLLVVAGLPLVLALLLLDRDSSNAILYAVAGLSAGPAVAATLHCMRKMLREKDLDPARDFVRGYRLNVAVALRFWAPAVATATILLLNLGHLAGSEAATAPALRAAILLVALIGALWLTNMLVISTSFTFRLRDLARLSVFYLGASLRITLGNLGCLFLAGALLVLASEWSLLLAGSVLAGLVALTTADLDAQVEARFTAAADDTAKTTHLPEQGQDRGPGSRSVAQRPQDVRDRDMESAKEAGMDALTVNVFSWAPPQPDERTDDFTMLARFLDRLESTSTSVCLATGTSTHPAWMARADSDIARTTWTRRHGSSSSVGVICRSSTPTSLSSRASA